MGMVGDQLNQKNTYEGFGKFNMFCINTNFRLVLIQTMKNLYFSLMVMLTSGFAQTEPSLRELAELNEMTFGAAVWTYHLDNPKHSQIMAQEFNSLTFEHEAKMCMVQKQRSVFDFEAMDKLIVFAEENQMSIRGHTLIWHECTPSWVEDGDFSREEMIEIMRDHIYAVVGRYKGRIAVWDVVNEAIDGGSWRETIWYKKIGEDYLDLAFQFAHEADPNAKLYYNDYGAEGINQKSDRIYAMLQDMLAQGIPVHGVGLQAHITLGDTSARGWLQSSKFEKNINRFGELGLTVDITEFDVRYSGETTEAILQKQAADYYNLLNTCLANPYCHTFVVWGVTDRFSWLRQASFVNNPTVKPLLFSDTYEPKPAYLAVKEALARAMGTPLMTDDELKDLVGQ
jgi:GH35 family endo-1,4-beta-xylanase